MLHPEKMIVRNKEGDREEDMEREREKGREREGERERAFWPWCSISAFQIQNQSVPKILPTNVATLPTYLLTMWLVGLVPFPWKKVAEH
jgi:hypothetical protein